MNNSTENIQQQDTHDRPLELTSRTGQRSNRDSSSTDVQSLVVSSLPQPVIYPRK